MKELTIREEDFGIGIRYETNDGFKEFVFDKEIIFQDSKSKSLNGLIKKVDESYLDELIKKKLFKGVVVIKKIPLSLDKNV